MCDAPNTSFSPSLRRRRAREEGLALLLVIILGVGLVMISMISLQTSLAHATTQDVQRDVFSARLIAESGLAQAMARLRDGGKLTPHSGPGATASWVTFSRGQFLYDTTYNAATAVTRIRVWGRVAADPAVSGSGVSPDDPSWDGTGYLVQGLEVAVKSLRYIPNSPTYFGNGAIERPLGGFDWTPGVDPADPSTWVPVSSNPRSYQSSWVPFEVSALDYPPDYLVSGGAPSPPGGPPHPYNIWTLQSPVGQRNVEAWFSNSAGYGQDPTTKVTPPPTSSYFDLSDPNGAAYPYRVDPAVPDVQTFAHELWRTYSSAPGTNLLGSGSHSGTYGTLGNPAITFATGELRVPAGTSFTGAGILVIRDDYDPETQSDNTPGTRASLRIEGSFNWTGLVIIAGWTPQITVDSTPGAQATIVGSLFGEDSVQSGGEVSLDSATIILQIENTFRVLFSHALFEPGGLVHEFLPFVRKEVVAVREI